MNNKEIKELFRKNRPMLVIIMLSVIVLVGSSYAWYTVSIESKDTTTVTAGNLDLVLSDESGVINLTNTVPQSDNNGLSNAPYSFTVKNNGSISNKYYVYLDDDAVSGTRISDSNIRYSLEKNSYSTGAVGLNTLNGANGKRLLAEGVLQPGEVATYKLRVWVAESATTEIAGQVFKAKIRIEGEQTKHIANEPELRGDMIPVTYNGTNWVKADYTKSNWYNYDNQNWANAVTIKSDKRTTYKSAAVGTTINISDVNLMLVWIPRYSYTLRDKYGYKIDGASDLSQATPGAFDIRFVDTGTVETGTGKYTGSIPSEYFTPSSFCWGNSCDVESTRNNEENKEIPGIWISKFELTGTINAITSIPNNTQLTNQTNQAFFNAIKTQANNGTGTTNYGLSGNYDTHMIKNTEWGAMAYLSQSKYGKYGNTNYTNANKEIYINNHNGKQSGCSKGEPGTGETGSSNGVASCPHTYETKEGIGASTTGTIYGIYDTSGGANTRVMGNYNKEVGDSGFTSDTMPEAKYYNLYTTTTGIKGDATNVDGTNGFYTDSQSFVSSGHSWVGRSQYYNNGFHAGIFAYNTGINNGGAYSDGGTYLSISTW